MRYSYGEARYYHIFDDFYDYLDFYLSSRQNKARSLYFYGDFEPGEYNNWYNMEMDLYMEYLYDDLYIEYVNKIPKYIFGVYARDQTGEKGNSHRSLT